MPDQEMHRQSFIEPGAIQLWTDSWDGKGSAVLLIGGAGAISAFWPDQFCQDLADQGHQVICYDQRDTGFATHVDFETHPYDLNDLVNDALSVLDAFDVPRAHIVGHSMGGFIAQLLAIDHADRVRSITSISSHSGSPEVPPPAAETWDLLLANQPTGEIETDLAGYMKVWRHLNGDLPFDEALAEAYTREIYKRNPATLPADNHVAAQRDMRDRTTILASVQVPALVIHGEQDLLVPQIGGRLTAEALPSSTYLTLPGAGHMFFNRDTWRTIGAAMAPHLNVS